MYVRDAQVGTKSCDQVKKEAMSTNIASVRTQSSAKCITQASCVLKRCKMLLRIGISIGIGTSTIYLINSTTAT